MKKWLVIPFLLFLFSGLANATIYTFEPITNDRVYPHIQVSSDYIGNVIFLRSCPGEFIPATFVIKPDADLDSLLIVPSDLTGGFLSSIPKENIDVKVVKCWYQAGDDTVPQYKDMRVYMPELLLKNDGLVQVNYHSQTQGWNNLLTSTGYHPINNVSEGNDLWIVNDAAILQPVSVKSGQNKQFWVTIYIPEGTPNGEYEGSLTLAESGVSIDTVQINLEVLPFTLPESPIEVGVYNSLRIYPNTPSLSQYWGGTEQVSYTLENMKNHGLTSVPIGQRRVWNIPLFETYIEMMYDTGFSLDTVYNLLPELYWLSSPSEVTQECSALINFFNTNYGTLPENMYFYPRDEQDLTLSGVPDLISAVQALGARTFCAQSGQYALSALYYNPPLLDIALLAGWPVPSVIAAYHDAGLEVGNYGNPQAGEEKPFTYRCNYGLLLWKFDIDMSCTYGLCQGTTTAGRRLVWNDWNREVYKMSCFVYPTTDGCVDTMEWEGFREGVNDIRYVTKLEQVIEETKARGQKATDAELYLSILKDSDLSQKDLTIVRNEVINHIIKLENRNIPGFEFILIFITLGIFVIWRKRR